MTTGIYIHIPYCISKCDYCDFLSFPLKTPNEYVDALIKEIKSSQITTKIDTLYIGGGTPTALPSPLLCKIINTAKELPLLPNAEITVEANPGTLTAEYLKALKHCGVNRLSFGLQTTHPHLLKLINRKHTKEEFLQNYATAIDVGINNINIDLMFALPTQTLKEWQETLEEVITLSPQHISAYSLTPAENTPLYTALENNKLTLPTDEVDRNMYHTAIEMLKKAGFIHYEISNFAKPNHKSQHNINCWKRVPYIGFGLGAHSFDGKNRWYNTENMANYINSNEKKEGIQSISESEALLESIILGLRLSEGINENLTINHKPTVQNLIKNGLLVQNGSNIKLTAKGMDLANQVFTAFL